MAKKKSYIPKTKRNKSQKLQDDMKSESEAISEGNQPTITRNADGSATVSFEEDTSPEEEIAGGLGSYDPKSEHYGNLVSVLDEEQRNKLETLVLANVQSDESARGDWMKTMQMGLDLIGTKVEEKNTPFEGACSAQHPLLMESAVKFQSKASNELLPASGPVKCKIMGDVTTEKEEQANRVKAHMNYQITEEMTEFYTDSERMLLYVPLVGSGFKKTYYNAHLERPCSEFIPADQFIVPNSASDLHRADRYTHVLYKTDYEIEADCASGLYELPEDGLGLPAAPKLSDVQKKTHMLIGITVGLGERDKVYTLYEQHINLFIEGLDEVTKADGKKYKLASPYILTVDSTSRKLIGLRRNWKEDDKKRKKKVQFSHYCFVPSFNFYGYGYLHLLGNLQLSLTSALRSLVDAGQFANLQGGFKLKGVRILDDGSPIHPGQFKDLECAVQDINKALMVMPFKEPSSVLYQMLEFLDRKGQQFADSTEQIIADSTNNGPVGTTMALLEASTKFFSAIHKRLHAALKNELKIIADINAETLDDNTEYNIENQTMKISRSDYGPTIAVTPVSDPNISSSAHRMAKAQAMLSLAQQSPALHDMREVMKHVYINMDYENVDKILPKPEEAQQNDPLTDIQSASEGKPIKAFAGQDHKAHIALKQAFMQDPESGQNPMMQKISIQIQANIQEHMLMQFVEQVKATAQAAQQPQQGQGQQGAPQPGQLPQGPAPSPQGPQPGQPPQGQVQPPAPGQPPQQGQGMQGQQPPKGDQDPMAIAAQKVAQLNQKAIQQQVDQAQQSPKDQAALMLAQAEMMDTQTKAKKQVADQEHKTAQIDIAQQKVMIDKAKVMHSGQMQDKKHANTMEQIVTTKGLDSMVAGMSQGHATKSAQALEHQRTLGKLANTSLQAKLQPPSATPK